ncbi:MAG: MATE family efflux transporter, partial [Bacteroidales bacterium]|nr:MATE family efflux transporter [Bacteroidales bacterium]
KRHEEAAKMASTTFFLSSVAVVVLGAIALCFLEPISIAFGSTPTILPYTTTYLGIMLLGAPFVTATMTLNNQLRFQGNAFWAMIGMLTGAVLNVALVPLFTFTFGLGIAGTAIGTVLSEIFGFVVLYVMALRSESIRLSIKKITFARHYMVEMVKGGTPSLSRQGLASVSTMLLNLAAASFGDAAIAGMSIVGRVSFVVFSVVIGIGQGFQPFCGFNYGAGLYKRVRQGYFYAIKLSLIFLAACCLGGFIFAEGIVDLMRHDAQVVAVGATALRWQIATWPLTAFIIMSNMALQTSGWAISANVVAALRNGLCFIPLIIVLPTCFGILGVEMCQTWADVISAAITLPLMLRYFKALSKMEGSTAATRGPRGQ